MEAVAEVTRLAVLAAASLSLGQGLEEAAERVIQAGLTPLGAGVLKACWPPTAPMPDRAPSATWGHQAEFVSYRDKTVDTALGLVAIRRAWYHCAVCGYGFAARDARLGVAGQTTSPGLRKMIARAAAAVAFAAAARLISELAGITFTGKRAGRRAEADGAAAAAMIEAQAAAIAARTLMPLPPTRRCPTCCMSAMTALACR